MQNSSNKNEIDFSNYPAILACWNSEEGQREFAAWQAEQAHIATKEKQEVPAGELPALLIVCDFCRVRPGGRTLFLFVLISSESALRSEQR